MNIKIIFIACLLLLPYGATWGNVIKWTDEKGKVHFGDQVPEKYRKKSKQVNLDRGNVVENNNAMKNRRVIKNRDTRKRREEAKVNADRHTAKKNGLIARRAQEDKCQKEYGMSCDRVNNWQHYAREKCKKRRLGRQCNDEKYLERKYRPYTLAEKEEIARQDLQETKKSTVYCDPITIAMNRCGL